jgi:hypothetical protein
VTGNSDVGGVVGWNDQSIVGKSYSTANTTGRTSRVGRLVGEDRRKGIVSSSFWDTETGGQATSDGGTGEATAEMKSIAAFSEVP